MFKKYLCTMQHDASDCAAAALSTVLLAYKCEMSIMKIREIIGTDLYGTSVKGIVDGLEKLHFETKAMRVDIDDIKEDITFPAIAQIHTKEGLNHFVVIHKVKKDNFVIADPAKGIKKLSRDEFSELFTGVLVLMIPTSKFENMKYKDKGMFDLFCALILPQKKLLITIILASLVLSIIGILASTELQYLWLDLKTNYIAIFNMELVSILFVICGIGFLTLQINSQSTIFFVTALINIFFENYFKNNEQMIISVLKIICYIVLVITAIWFFIKQKKLTS